MFGLDRTVLHPLLDPDPIDNMETGFAIILATIALLSIYLPRARHLEKLLPPAVAVVCLLSAQIWVTSAEEMHVSQLLIAVILFVGSAIYLAATGEIRMELKQVTKREDRLAEIQRRLAIAKALEMGNIEDLSSQQTKLLATPSNEASVTSAMSVVTENVEQPLDISQEGSVYHFADEATAAQVAEDSTGALARSMSQAISRGGMKMADAELYSLIDKQRKATWMPAFHDTCEDSDALGVLVSRYCDFDGNEILKTLMSALSDANFHSLNSKIFKIARKEGLLKNEN